MSEENKIKIKFNQLTIVIVLIALLIGIALIFYKNSNYIKTLENQNQKKDSVIEILSKKDSLLNQITTLSYDSIRTKFSLKTKEKGGKVIKYNELANSLDSISEKYNELKFKASNVQNSLQLDNEILKGDRMTLEKNYSDIIKKYNALIKDYNNLGKEFNKADKIIDDLKSKYYAKYDSVKLYKFIVNCIESNYGITYGYTETEKSKTISLKADKLDSALRLFPVFKNNLKFDSKKNQWVIYK